MKSTTQSFLDLWLEARTRFSDQLQKITDEDLRKKLSPSPNSAGFLIRHIGDVELLFAKNVFGATDVKVSAKTVIAQTDTGEWTDREELLRYVSSSFEALQSVIGKQPDAEWETEITTPQFGTRTKAEALGRIISHTAYHAGQLAMTVKHGSAQ